MEAVGLAVGVVSLGLDLATRLQTYIEAVKGAGDRISELSADVSATASIVRQIADLLNSHQQEPDHFAPSTPSHPPIFTAKGVSDIEAQLRRCDKTYKIIIDILIRATSGAVNPPVFATAVGLSDLTASKLGKLASRAKWPWLEPRIKACQKQLKSIKVDLLLSLQIASLARHRLGPRNESADDREEDLALKDAAEKLIQKRAETPATWNSTNPWSTFSSTAPTLGNGTSVLQSLMNMEPLEPMDLGGLSEETEGDIWSWPPPKPSSSTSAPSVSLASSKVDSDSAFTGAQTVASVSGGGEALAARQFPVVQLGTQSPARRTTDHLEESREKNTREGKEAPTVLQTQTQLFRRKEADTSNPWKRQAEEERLSTLAEKAEGISIGSLDDAEDLEAWFLVRDIRDDILLKLPVRGPTMHKTIKACGAEEGADSTLEQFLDLSSEHRAAVWDVMDCALKKDARARTLVGLYTRSSHPKLPRRAEAMVLVSTGTEEEVVNVVDLDGRAWRLPYYALKTALEAPWQLKDPSGARYELSRRCDYVSPMTFQLSVDAGGRESISLAGLYEHLRPGLKICMQKAPLSDDAQRVTDPAKYTERKQLNLLQRSDTFISRSETPRPLPAVPPNVVPQDVLSAESSFRGMEPAYKLADTGYHGFGAPFGGDDSTNSFGGVDWYSAPPASQSVDPEAAVFKELFGDGDTDGKQAQAGASVEELLAKWTHAERTT